MAEIKSVFKTFVGEPVGKRPLQRPRHRRKDVRMDLREIRWKIWTGYI
jgi:hypothetical protein